jgi:hypothetical protein
VFFFNILVGRDDNDPPSSEKEENDKEKEKDNNFVNDGSNEKFKEIQGDKDKAIDEGGPSRFFLSQIWRQLPCLRLCRKVSKNITYSVELFDENCVPATNEYIISRLQAHEIEVEIQEQVKQICQMIGRFIFYCIAMSDRDTTRFEEEILGIKLPLADHVLPNVYRYYYFQNKDPTNLSYELSHLVQDVFAIKHLTAQSLEDKMAIYMAGVLDLDSELNDKRTKFREAALEDLFVNRSWVVESIKDGLTLGGLYNFCFLFLFLSVQSVNYCVLCINNFRFN